MNLKERLQLKAAREGANWDSGPRSIDFYGGHASTHEMIDKLAGALEEYQIKHSHAPEDKHMRIMGDSYGWCDFCSTRVDFYRPCLAGEALQELEKWLVENVR